MGRKNSEHKNLIGKNARDAMFILCAGLILAGLLFIKNKNNPDIHDSLTRDEDGKTQNVKLIAQSVYGEEQIDIEVLSRTYSESEKEELKKCFPDALKRTILADNGSFDSIKNNLNFPEKLEGYPFEIEYRVRPRGYISSSGELVYDVEEDTEIEIEITYSLEGFEETELIEGVIVPIPKSEEELFFKKVRKDLEEKNENERNDKNLELPKELDGVDISWSLKKDNKVFSVIFLTITCALIFLFKDKFSFSENEKKRREKIIEEYPDFAVKYALLNEAGLTHRQVLERLGSEFKKSKKGSPLYEEIYRVCLDMKGGLSLTEALDQMASRVSIREITFFVGRINRNIKKGGRDFAAQIREAADESSSEKREKIRRKAETAGTRLLIPMVFLLIIVFALIMIPAFDSFSF